MILGFGGSEPYLIFMGTTVYDNAGNDNGRLDPGETVDLTATLLNFGGADLININTTISTVSSFVTITDNTGYFGNLPVDSVKENTNDPYVLVADAATPQGHEADITMIVTANGGFADTIAFKIVVGQCAPSDTGYYYSYFSGGPFYSCPVFAWFAIDSTQSANPGVSMNLIDNQTLPVALPFTFKYYGTDYDTVSICSNGFITMGTSTDVDWTNSGIPNPDGPPAMIAGLWDDLDPGNAGLPADVYYYYDAVNHRFVVEFFQVEHWPTGNPETFEFLFLDENYYPTPTDDGEIIVQYLYGMHQYDNTIGIENVGENLGIEYFCDSVYHEWAYPIEDGLAIKFTTWPPDQGPGVEESGAGADLTSCLRVQPTITRSHTTISYIVPHSSGAQIRIFDATGRVVYAYTNLPGEEGMVQWHSRDSGGSQVANGIYFVYLETENTRAIDKVLIVE